MQTLQFSAKERNTPAGQRLNLIPQKIINEKLDLSPTQEIIKFILTNYVWQNHVEFNDGTEIKSSITNVLDGNEVPAGRYVYPFSFLLPENLPSTYDSEYGYIDYKIKGIVDRPWKFDYECELMVIVHSPIDLNKVPRTKVSIRHR